MFERFTTDAREVVRGAAGRAERLGAAAVTEEHLLLALLDRQGGRAGAALAALGVIEHRDSVDRALGEARRRGGLSQADTEALAGLGIDVAEVVSRVEEAHGEGVLDEVRTPKSRRWMAHRPFTQGAKQILEKALRVALGRGDRYIGDEHVLLAMAARPGVVAEVLAGHGATYERIESLLPRGRAA
jgi:ATP-dependent Clp protease ATP-binding subunit ClpA